MFKYKNSRHSNKQIPHIICFVFLSSPHCTLLKFSEWKHVITETVTAALLDAVGQINALPAKTNTQLHWQISHKCPRTTTDGGLKRQCWLLHHSVPDSRFILKCIKTAPTAGNSTPQKLHSTAQSLAERCWYLLYPLHKRNSAPWTGNNQLTLTISALYAIQRNWP